MFSIRRRQPDEESKVRAGHRQRDGCSSELADGLLLDHPPRLLFRRRGSRNRAVADSFMREDWEAVERMAGEWVLRYLKRS